MGGDIDLLSSVCVFVRLSVHPEILRVQLHMPFDGLGSKYHTW